MSYIIDGPVTVGDTGQNSTIKGAVLTPNLTTTVGDMIYCTNTGSGALTRLALGGTGALLTTTGGTAPAWLAAGSNGQVLTLAGGVPTWSAAANSSTTPFSFSAFASATQAITVAASTTGPNTAITTWSIASPGFNGLVLPAAFNVATGTFTVGIAGTYLFNATVAFTDTSNTGSRSLLIVNTFSSTTLATKQIQPTPDITINDQIEINVSLSLAATATIQLQMQITTGATGTTTTVQDTSNTWLSVTRLS